MVIYGRVWIEEWYDFICIWKELFWLCMENRLFRGKIIGKEFSEEVIVII